MPTLCKPWRAASNSEKVVGLLIRYWFSMEGHSAPSPAEVKERQTHAVRAGVSGAKLKPKYNYGTSGWYKQASAQHLRCAHTVPFWPPKTSSCSSAHPSKSILGRLNKYFSFPLLHADRPKTTNDSLTQPLQADYIAFSHLSHLGLDLIFRPSAPRARARSATMEQIALLKDDVMARLTDYYSLTPRRFAPRWFALISVFAAIIIVLLFPVFKVHQAYRVHTQDLTPTVAPTIIAHDALDYLINYPVAPTEFGEMGQRVQLLIHRAAMLEQSGTELTPSQAKALSEKVDQAIVASFPFIKSPSSSTRQTAFQALRSTCASGSKGIVISLGKKDFRYACHLIGNIRNVLRSRLPIQISYAGEDDLPVAYRDKLTSLGEDIETLDLLKTVDDATLELAHGTFGTKPLAMLVSKFEQVILLDADAVFIQPPEVLFKASGYKETGTYFFHDRLLNRGIFKERHDWWEEEMKHNPPSAALLKSLVYTEKYSAEQDSGVVVLDKSRTPVLLALLHVCWQNSAAGRKFMQGKVFGDKETYWFGFELSRVPYYFEKHYGNGLGPVTDSKKICGNAISHTDEADRLLWFNGGLLANKYQDKKTFGDFSHWMLDGHWLPQTGGDGVSCEDQGEILTVDEKEIKVLSDTVREAKLADDRFKNLIDLTS